MKWEQKNPQYGDIVRTKVSFYYHYGIYADRDTIIQFGAPRNDGVPREQIAVCVTDEEGFLSEGGSAECAVLDRREKKERRSPEETVKVALSRVGETGYDFLHNNCEHFVNSCVFGRSVSSFTDGERRKIREKLKRKSDKTE